VLVGTSYVIPQRARLTFVALEQQMLAAITIRQRQECLTNLPHLQCFRPIWLESTAYGKMQYYRVNYQIELPVLSTIYYIDQNTLIRCVQKKTPTQVFYISVENVQIFTKFSGNVQEKKSIRPVNKFRHSLLLVTSC